MKNDTLEDRWKDFWSKVNWQNEIQNYYNNSWNNFSFPTVKRVMARTLGGDYNSKSKQQQQKEDRINKLRKLEEKKPNVILPDDVYDGLISVQPLSAPIGKLHYVDFHYETEEEKRKKKQKIRREKLENLNGIDFIKNMQLNIIRKDKLKYIEEIIKNN